MRYRKRSFFIRKFIPIIMLTGVLLFVGSRYLGLFNVKDLISSIETKLTLIDTEILQISTSSTSSSNSSSNSISSTALGSASKKLSQDVSFVLTDTQTNQILKSQNTDHPRAPASTLKLLTGLIANEALKETDIVKVGSEVNIEGSKLGLSPGDEISVHDLLTALYVHSSNDAAAALAVKISGSIPKFAQKMNEYALTLGCQQSHFTNPHGLPDPDQYTTAKDLSIIANHFIKDERLMNYVQKAHASVQWKDAQGKTRSSELQTTNELLGVYPGDRGLKTGTTTEAGQCLVSYVTRADGNLLLVLLGSEHRYVDSINLLDEAWAEQRTKAALKNLSKDPRSLILSPGIF